MYMLSCCAKRVNLKLSSFSLITNDRYELITLKMSTFSSRIRVLRTLDVYSSNKLLTSRSMITGRYLSAGFVLLR
jgi:hypothetical protein